MLDTQLRPDRGPNGEPSATDFLVIELPEIVDAFAVGFDELPEVVEALGWARVYIGPALSCRLWPSTASKLPMVSSNSSASRSTRRSDSFLTAEHVA